MCPDINSVQRQAERLYFLTAEKLNELGVEPPGHRLEDGSEPIPSLGVSSLPSRFEMLNLEGCISWALECLSSSGRLPTLDRLLSFAQSTGAGPVAFTTTCCCLAQMASVLVLLGSGENALALSAMDDSDLVKEPHGTAQSTSPKTPLELQSGTSLTTPGTQKISPDGQPEAPVTTRTSKESKKGQSRKPPVSTTGGSPSPEKKPDVDKK